MVNIIFLSTLGFAPQVADEQGEHDGDYRPPAAQHGPKRNKGNNVKDFHAYFLYRYRYVILFEKFFRSRLKSSRHLHAQS